VLNERFLSRVLSNFKYAPILLRSAGQARTRAFHQHCKVDGPTFAGPLAKGLFNDLDNAVSAGIDQHCAIIHDGIAIFCNAILPCPRGSAASTFPICRRSRQRIGQVTLQAPPRSADRTRSPASVSGKREFFKREPETIAKLAERMPQIGAWRPEANSQKPAIGRPFCEYLGHVP
jgi:hypothetical protein